MQSLVSSILRSRRSIFGIKLLLSLTLFFVAASTVSFEQIRYANPRPEFLIASAALIGLQLALAAFRSFAVWRILHIPMPLQMQLKLSFASALVSSFGGTAGSDVARVWITSRYGIAARTAIKGVILDRAATLFGLALLVGLSAPLLALWHADRSVVFASLALSFAALIAPALLGQLTRLPQRFHYHPVVSMLTRTGAAIRQLFFTRACAVPILLAIASQLAFALAAYVAAAGFGLQVTVIQMVVLMQPVVLFTALPISIGGWGVRESAMVAMLALVGVPSAQSLALSVGIGIISTLVTLPAAFLMPELNGLRAEGQAFLFNTARRLP
jgi:glycosyltransferase 2 family protein